VHGLHFVTGKGGVGTSTIAAAIAITAAARGARTLAIELGQPGGLSRMLRGHAAITIDCYEGAAALAEYLARKVRLGRLVRAVTQHPLYDAFVGAAPGLRELMAIGKIRDAFVLQDRWDVVVVDAGASGHALEHLRMPAAAEDAFDGGRVHREAAVNAALLRDRARVAIHVVATPEEMPLREAAQTIGALRALDLATGALFANQCAVPPPPGVDDAIARISDPLVAAPLRAARSWAWIQEEGLAAVERELGVIAVRLPKIRGADPARALAPIVAEAVC